MCIPCLAHSPRVWRPAPGQTDPAQAGRQDRSTALENGPVLALERALTRAALRPQPSPRLARKSPYPHSCARDGEIQWPCIGQEATACRGARHLEAEAQGDCGDSISGWHGDAHASRSLSEPALSEGHPGRGDRCIWTQTPPGLARSTNRGTHDCVPPRGLCSRKMRFMGIAPCLPYHRQVTHYYYHVIAMTFFPESPSERGHLGRTEVAGTEGAPCAIDQARHRSDRTFEIRGSGRLVGRPGYVAVAGKENMMRVCAPVTTGPDSMVDSPTEHLRRRRQEARTRRI